jgi:VWFA-related protein
MRILLYTVLLSPVAPMSLAQTPDSPTLKTTTTLIVVPTLVQTPAKDVVYSLTAADFSLTDNGVAQNITLEPVSTQPLSLVVLIQTGGAAQFEFQYYTQLETMLESLLETSSHAPNQVAIVNFDSKPVGASDFTSNVAEWTDAINHPDPGDSGAAILDSLAYALRMLDSQPAANRRAILLISQPTDTGSKTPLKEILRTAAETNTSVYTLTFSPQQTALKQALTTPGPHPPIVVNPANPPVLGYFDLSLPLNLLLSTMQKNLSASIATLTGGETATFDDRHSLDDDLNTIGNHIRNRYLLTFQPISPKPGLHKLVVQIPGHPELTISARTSYWSAESEVPGQSTK